MDVGACTSDIYPDEERTPGDLFQRKNNARAGCFSLHLDFLFELNEVCRQACEEGGQGWREMARSRKDILHLPIQSVAFSNFEMKEKKAGRFAAECIRLNSKVQKEKNPKQKKKKPGSAWRGILHAGHC